MNKPTLITLCIVVHISFIALQIYKHSTFVNTEYQKQEYERLITELHQKKEERTQILYAMKNRPHIQKYAQEKLNMQPLTLNQIKKVQRHEPTI